MSIEYGKTSYGKRSYGSRKGAAVKTEPLKIQLRFAGDYTMEQLVDAMSVCVARLQDRGVERARIGTLTVMPVGKDGEPVYIAEGTQPKPIEIPIAKRFTRIAVG